MYENYTNDELIQLLKDKELEAFNLDLQQYTEKIKINSVDL